MDSRKSMIEINPITEYDLKTIAELAHKIWWPTYSSFVPLLQIETMLAEYYNPEALKSQIVEGQTFLLIKENGVPFGFTSYSPTEDPSIVKIHKLYVDPDFQGKGAGRLFIEKVAQIALEKGAQQLELMVNRHNPAVSFYKKMGFQIFKPVDTPYHQFVLEDFMMRKTLYH